MPRFAILAATLCGLLAPVQAHALTLVASDPRPGDMRVSSAGDFNGDGRSDLAISSPSDATPELAIVFGRPGLDTLEIPPDPAAALRIAFTGVSDLLGVGEGPVGDIDGDGFDDITVTFTRPPGTPNQGVGEQIVLRGSPRSGTAEWRDLAAWQIDPSVFSGGPGTFQPLGDLDGDGLGDVVINHGYSGTAPCSSTVHSVGPCAAVRRGPTLSIAERIDIGATQAIGAYPAGDVDGDGRTEIRAGALGDRDAYLLFAQPRGREPAFTFARFSAGGDAAAFTTGVGDVNGDGRADLALWDSTFAWSSVFFGRPGLESEAFDLANLPEPTRALPDGLLPGSSDLAAGDIDGDGIGDLLARHPGPAEQHVVLPGGRTTQPWRNEDALPVPAAGPGSMSVWPVGDVDADGRAELVVGSYDCPEWPDCQAFRTLVGAEDDAAQLTSLRVSPTAFFAGAYRPSLRRGTRITTTLTAAARIRLTFTPLLGGARRTLELDRPAGTSSVPWDGRVSGRRLPFGPYRVTGTVAGGDAATSRSIFILS